jgi:translation initiation factor 2B subunit (eIF-2B alpha/beta/delta family)
VLEAIELAAQEGHHLDVYITEARPRYLGRKTARTLASIDRVDATLIVDSAAGHYLDECDRVALGMSCIVDDTLYNRVGTFPIAATAAELAVPVSVFGASAKIIDEGFAFENEFRSPSEVMREPAEGFDVANPAYDATPKHLLDSIVTDEGIRNLQ